MLRLCHAARLRARSFSSAGELDGNEGAWPSAGLDLVVIESQAGVVVAGESEAGGDCIAESFTAADMVVIIQRASDEGNNADCHSQRAWRQALILALTPPVRLRLFGVQFSQRTAVDVRVSAARGFGDLARILAISMGYLAERFSSACVLMNSDGSTRATPNSERGER